MLKPDPTCPLCAAQLEKTGGPYTVETLFSLWEPISFSNSTIDQHREMSDATSLFKCTSCQLEIFLPKIIGTPDFYVEAYSLNETASSDVFSYSDEKWDFDIAKKLIEDGQRLIEFGCGNGNFLSKISNPTVEAVGIEYNEKAVKVARSQGLTVFSSEQDPSDFGNNYDIAFSFHVLEHVEDAVSFVKNMFASVRPGGFVAISVPNQNGPIKYIDPCIMNMPPHHATRWNLSSFEALAKNIGAKIVKVKYEPLLISNHSYYSIHWINQVFSNTSIFSKFMRNVSSIALRVLFGGLKRLGFKTFPFLKGQAIFVVMKNEVNDNSRGDDEIQN